MSTNKSQNLNLHLWEPEDDFLRTEFNENFAALDTAVKAEESARNAAVSNALSAANAAQQTANAALAAKPYVTGSYTGTGAEMSINLGFRPSFLIVSGVLESSSSSYGSGVSHYLALTGGNVLLKAVTLSDSGFTVHPGTDSSSFYSPMLVRQGYHYDYIAFR